MKPESKPSDPGSKYAPFELTHWTIIQSASDPSSPEALAALEELCRIYWRPLYSYVRRRGHTKEDAQDLTQSFFERLLDKNYLSAVDRRKGKFRSFLLAALEHFLANEWRRGRAQKRGGGATFVSFDEAFDDGLPNSWADIGFDAERVFKQQWANALLNQVLSRLEEEFTKTHTLEFLMDIRPALTGETSDASYKEIATKHSTTEGAIKMTVNRLRKRFRKLLIEEVAKTVSSPEELEEELRAIFGAFD
jgi:RNA polymerase sigma-70 factor (ECF subfamily)